MALVHLLDLSSTTDTFIGYTTFLRIASSPDVPLPGSHCGRVSQPCRRLASGPRGRAASPVVSTERPGECLAFNPAHATPRQALSSPFHSPPPRSVVFTSGTDGPHAPPALRGQRRDILSRALDRPPRTRSTRDQLHPPPSAASQPADDGVWPCNHRRSFVSFFSSPRGMLAPQPMNQFVSCAVLSTRERNASRCVFFQPHLKVVGCCEYFSCFLIHYN